MKEAINLLRIKYRINNRGIIEFDMFPWTLLFQKTIKNLLICSRKRKVQKISPRHQSERLEPRWVRSIDDECKKRMSAWKTAWIQGFPVICRTREMFFPAAEIPGSPVFLCAWLFAETHPQPFGAALGGQGCVDGKDEIWNGLMCSREHVYNLNLFVL